MFPICISFCKQCISTFPDFVLFFFIKPAKYTIIKGILTRWLHSEITSDGHSSVQPSPALNLLQIWLKFYLRSFFLYLALITPHVSSAKSLLPFMLMGTCLCTSMESCTRMPNPAKFAGHALVSLRLRTQLCPPALLPAESSPNPSLASLFVHHHHHEKHTLGSKGTAYKWLAGSGIPPEAHRSTAGNFTNSTGALSRSLPQHGTTLLGIFKLLQWNSNKEPSILPAFPAPLLFVSLWIVRKSTQMWLIRPWHGDLLM